MSSDHELSGLLDVFASGAVVLGPDVTCDGFHYERQVRVQSHVHTDHLSDFTTSKSRELVMSEGTRDLLSFDHPDLNLRGNIHLLSSGDSWTYNGTNVSLQSAGHMLGASQVEVKLKDGITLGYSGDFSWPLDQPVSVDALVLDATYGSPEIHRSYDQHAADDALLNIVRDRLGHGPIQLVGYSGVIERALLTINSADVAAEIPVLGNSRLRASIDTHRSHGWPLPEIVEIDSEVGRQAIQDGTYIRCWKGSEGGRTEGIVEGTTISLTKYRTREVLEVFSESNYRVGMSNHADFESTLEYVKATGAKYVVTDSRRAENEKARKLANFVQNELGISARTSTNTRTPKWGG